MIGTLIVATVAFAAFFTVAVKLTKPADFKMPEPTGRTTSTFPVGDPRNNPQERWEQPPSAAPAAFHRESWVDKQSQQAMGRLGAIANEVKAGELDVKSEHELRRIVNEDAPEAVKLARAYPNSAQGTQLLDGGTPSSILGETLGYHVTRAEELLAIARNNRAEGLRTCHRLAEDAATPSRLDSCATKREAS